MSRPEHLLPNDPAGPIDEAARDVWDAVEQALQSGTASKVSDLAVARLMTAAVKLYAAKTDGEGRTFRPLLGSKDEHVTATEVVTAASELLRSMSLGPMELALWYRRRPEDTVLAPVNGDDVRDGAQVKRDASSSEEKK